MGPNGKPGMDIFEIQVADSAALNAVTVTASDDPNYQWMVTYGSGTQKDYLKNIEAINVFVQGGGAGRWIPLAVTVNEIDGSTGDLTNSMHYAWVQGTGQGESFDAGTDISQATRTLMDGHQRGAWVDMGAGNDTVVGSGYGDDITLGAGTNYADGGANAGSPPWGGKAQDVLHVNVADQAAADAVAVTQLTTGMSGADAAAFTAGYTHKVVAGSEIDYIKGIEKVTVQIATSNSTSWVRDIPLAIVVQEANLADANIANYGTLAWVTGTGAGETIDLSGDTPLLSGALKTAMGQYQHGVWVDGGAGNDTITGTAYGDYFHNGPGNSKIDGGANLAANGQKAVDVFEIAAASTAELNAVTVAKSDDPNYQWMVTYGSGTQKDYLKNIEAVSVFVTGTNTGRYIPLTVNVIEASSANAASSQFMAWENGTSQDDTINPATDLSSAAQQRMAQYGRGVWVDAGAGNDTVTGSDYGDNFTLGSGTNYLDGGANRGLTINKGTPVDVLDVYATSQAAADAVSVTALTGTLSGADATAAANGYKFKVVNGSEVDYIKNVEQVNIQLWQDKNGDGFRNYASDSTNEVTFVRAVGLNVNGAPTFGGLPAGVVGIDAGYDNNAVAMIPQTGGKMLALSFVASTPDHGVYRGLLTRINADGSVDTTFGTNGSVYVGAPGETAAGMVQQADGKLLISLTVPPAATSDVRILRVNPDGSSDTSYGSNGSAVLSWGGHSDNVAGMKLLGDGKVLVYGTTSDGTQTDLAVTRLNADGSVDSTYGNSGTRVVAASAGNDSINGAAVLADGKLVLVGGVTGANGADTGLVKLNADGSLDTSFGTGGVAQVEFAAGTDNATALLVQGDGKLLVGGTLAVSSTNVNDRDVMLARFNADGSLDTTFGTAGKTVLHLTDARDSVSQLIPTADGGVAALLRSANQSVVVAKFTAAGVLDASFGNGGMTQLHVKGFYEAAMSLTEIGGKLLVFGETAFNTNYDQTMMLARLNADGSIDTSFAQPNATTLGGNTVLDGLHAKAIDTNVTIFDPELTASNYAGATLTLQRQGGASAEDVFAPVNGISFGNGSLTVNQTVIGTVSQAGGQLSVTFNNMANAALVNTALQGIGYTNTSGTPPASVTLAWSFSDGNTGAQGFGSALSATGTSTVTIGVDMFQRHLNPLDPTHASDGSVLANDAVIAIGNGTARGDTINAATYLDQDVKDLMAATGKGVFINAGPGDDTVTGTAYNDIFEGGPGNDRYDGGAGRDIYTVYVADQAQADAVVVAVLTAQSTGADATAFSAGYQYKVVNGSATDYLKNIELVQVQQLADTNGNGVHDSGEATTFIRQIPVALNLSEVVLSTTDATKNSGGTPLVQLNQFASVQGTPAGDSIDANALLSTATKGLMAQYTRGIYVDAAGGDDTIVGTGFGDTINAGSGTNYVDGGANAGTAPNGNRAYDTLQVAVATTADAAAVTATQLNGSMTGADLAAFNSGYTWRVNAPGQATYVKNVELVNVNVWSDANKNGLVDDGQGSFTYNRTIQLAVTVNEIAVSPTDNTKDTGGNLLSSDFHFAWATGTAGNDSASAAADVSSATQALMTQYGRGMYFDLGAGDDTVVGSQFGDNFLMGTGTNYVDGGANGGSQPGGAAAQDVVQAIVKTQAEAAQVQVLALSSASSGADATAFAAGYLFKVVNGAEIDYVKNVEAIDVNLWQDANSNGRIDGGELSFVQRYGTALTIDGAHPSSADPARDANGQLLSTYQTYAWANGTFGNDALSVNDIPAAFKAYMDQFQRGFYANLGAGDDTIVGSAYGDKFEVDSGTNYVDGGTQTGTQPNGLASYDEIEIRVADAAAAGAVTVTTLTSGMANATDAAAFANGYTQKVVAGSEIDYIKNIENLRVVLTDYNFVRNISLGLTSQLVEEDPANPGHAYGGTALSDFMHLVNVQADFGNNTFNPAQLGSTVAAELAQYGRGIYVAMGNGNDTVTGTSYGDNFTLGQGTNYADGGANQGVRPDGSAAMDVLEVYAGTQSAADAVTVTALTGTLTGTDLAAQTAGYQYKVVNGAEIDYVKNLERVDIMVWTDKNGDGARTYSGDAAVNEVTGARSVLLHTNSAPTFAGVPAGVVAYDQGLDFTPIATARQADGKILVLAGLTVQDDHAQYDGVLTRLNTDGTVDTTFGANGRVGVPLSGAQLTNAMTVLGNGKIVIGTTERVGTGADFGALQLNADGSVDTAFGTNGHADVSFSVRDDLAFGLQAQADGSLLLYGMVDSGASTGNDAGIARVTAAGVLDTTFGSNGVLALALSSGPDRLSASVAGADGTTYLVGRTLGASNTDVLVLRLAANGTLDATFGAGGKVVLPVGSYGDASNAVAVQADGKLLVAANAGQASGVAPNDWALLRLNTDGSLDSSFGTGGKVLLPLTPNGDNLQRVVLESDGKILLLGQSDAGVPQPFGAKLTVMRLNTDGSVDHSFGGGKVVVPLHGVVDQATALVEANGKLLLVGGTGNDTDFDMSMFVARLNMDGSLDTGFTDPSFSSLGGTTHLDGLHASAIDTNAAIYDAELAARNDYIGSTLTLARQGGASADDVFTGVDAVSLNAGKVLLNNREVATYSQNGGTLSIAFEHASQGDVNQVLHGIGYTNASSTPPASVTLAWTFSDNNDGGQGFGPAQQATGTSTITLGVASYQRHIASPGFTGDGIAFAKLDAAALIGGTAGADTITAAQVLDTGAQALADAAQRGVYIDGGPGNDTIVGTGYSDFLIGGKGTNYVDGGANAGAHVWGGAGRDVLLVPIANGSGDPAAVHMVALSSSDTDATDIAARTAGYEAKVINGTEIDYIKNVERVVVMTYNDANGNGVRDANENLNWFNELPVAMRVNEIVVSSTDPTLDNQGHKLADQVHFAWVESDVHSAVFNYATDISSATQALMGTYHHGLYVDTYGGDDSIAASPYDDWISVGGGTNYVDGGAGRDSFNVFVKDQPAADQVTVEALAVSATGPYADGYRIKVTAGTTVDYLKNIEDVNIQIWSDTNGDGVRQQSEVAQHGGDYYPLAASLNYPAAADAQHDTNGAAFAAQYQLGFVNAGLEDDNFDASSGLPADLQARLDQFGRGIYFHLGDGNDRAVGTAYGDTFQMGHGVSYFDGGANRGVDPQGHAAIDLLQVQTASSTAASAVTVNALTGNLSGADADAQAAGYQFKVVNGADVAYLKNIEAVSVSAPGTGNWLPLNPVFTAAAHTPVASAENGAPAVMTVADLMAGDTLVRAGVQLQKAMVIEYVDPTVATLQYSLDQGATWLNADAEQINGGHSLYLDGSAQLRELAFANAYGGTGFQYTGVDPSQAGGPSGRYVDFNSTPNVDTDYNHRGTVETDFSAVNDAPVFRTATGIQTLRPAGITDIAVHDTVVQADEWAVSVGYAGTADGTYNWILTRTSGHSGLFDTSFGTNGVVTLAPAGKPGDGNPPVASSNPFIAVQPDGKFLVAMSTYDSDGVTHILQVMRLNANGTTDTTYGTNGMLQTRVGLGPFDVTAISATADGKLLVAGAATKAGHFADFAVVRVDAGGQLDQGFGDHGMVLIDGADKERISDIAQFGWGKIVLVGTSGSGSASDVAVAALDEQGNLAPFAGTTGLKTIPVGQFGDLGQHTLIDPNGNLYIAGATYSTDTESKVFVMKMNGNGDLDNSFGTNGVAQLDIATGIDGVQDMVWSSDHLVLSTLSGGSGPGRGNATLVRLNGDGTLDTTFGPSTLGGKVSTNLSTLADYGYKLVVQPDEKLALFGMTAYDGNFDGNIMEARYLPNGLLDRTFGNQGGNVGGMILHTDAALASPLSFGVQVRDAELEEMNNYGGATLTVARHGGANAADTFTGAGNVHLDLANHQILVGTGVVGTADVTNGVLSITLNQGTSSGTVAQLTRGIAFTTADDAVFDIVFNDGNAGSQGSGGALAVTGQLEVKIGTLGGAGADAILLGAGNDTFDGAAGTDSAAIFWNGSGTLSYNAVVANGQTTVTIHQNSGGVVSDLLTLTRTGTSMDWTVQAAAGATTVHGLGSATMGVDHISNIELFDVMNDNNQILMQINLVGQPS
ncbi:MAG: hypothetical protein ACXU8N_19715 [Telluria sp.]